jgi:hypothetical protein
MTASEFASLLHAKRTAKGKWVAVCPAHPDRKPSLSIAEGKKVPVVIKCMSHGCDTRDILEAIGLSWGDLFDAKHELSPEMKARLDLQKRLDWLEGRAIACAANAYFMHPEKRNYWLEAERRIMVEIRAIKDTLNPEAKKAREKREKLDKFIERFGWDHVWKRFLESEKGRAIAQKWGI